jgi:hypothetical protein
MGFFAKTKSRFFGSGTAGWNVLIYGYLKLRTPFFCKKMYYQSWKFKMATVFTIIVAQISVKILSFTFKTNELRYGTGLQDNDSGYLH